MSHRRQSILPCVIGYFVCHVSTRRSIRRSRLRQRSLPVTLGFSYKPAQRCVLQADVDDGTGGEAFLVEHAELKKLKAHSTVCLRNS